MNRPIVKVCGCHFGSFPMFSNFYQTEYIYATKRVLHSNQIYNEIDAKTGLKIGSRML
jgi:hypothetical protein